MEAVAKGLLSAAVAYTAHYGTVKLYDSMCVPDGWWGFVQGIATAGSPICQAGVQVIQSTQVSYSTMILMGITRVLIDMVAPGASKVLPPGTG
jgi:hypothetical protein